MPHEKPHSRRRRLPSLVVYGMSAFLGISILSRRGEAFGMTRGFRLPLARTSGWAEAFTIPPTSTPSTPALRPTVASRTMGPGAVQGRHRSQRTSLSVHTSEQMEDVGRDQHESESHQQQQQDNVPELPSTDIDSYLAPVARESPLAHLKDLATAPHGHAHLNAPTAGPEVDMEKKTVEGDKRERARMVREAQQEQEKEEARATKKAEQDKLRQQREEAKVARKALRKVKQETRAKEKVRAAEKALEAKAEAAVSADEKAIQEAAAKDAAAAKEAAAQQAAQAAKQTAAAKEAAAKQAAKKAKETSTDRIEAEIRAKAAYLTRLEADKAADEARVEEKKREATETDKAPVMLEPAGPQSDSGTYLDALRFRTLAESKTDEGRGKEDQRLNVLSEQEQEELSEADDEDDDSSGAETSTKKQRLGIDDLIRAGARKVTGVYRRKSPEEKSRQGWAEGPEETKPVDINDVWEQNLPDPDKKRKKGRYASVAKTPEWNRLQQHAKHVKRLHLRALLNDPVRCTALTAETDGILLDYSRQLVTLGSMRLLLDLAERQELTEKIAAMKRGDKINFTEKRPVLHAATRATREEEIIVDGVDTVRLVHQQLDRIRDYTEAVRNGEIRGHTGRLIRNVISVGIGGSYLGPSFIAEVLATEREGIFTSQGFTLRFLSNVDPVDVERSISNLDAEETLVVIVSKTFTTSETMLNARTMRQWLWDRMSDGNPNDEVTATHVVACASESARDNVLEFGVREERFFQFWDWVGGRYSVCSSAGVVPLSLKYGFSLIEQVLAGARSMDRHFFSAPLHKNLPVLMGLLGVWNLSFLGYKARTMLPYSEAMQKFPAHVQQVDMESNGKGVTSSGKVIDYDVGEIDFGESGTNSQHSFFQLLHMGQPVPCDFIGFVESQNNLVHTEGETLSPHDELMANFFAQPDALAMGRSEEELMSMEPDIDPELIPHRVFAGNRPSTSLLLPQLTAYTAGQMLALYEHRTAVQGFIWDINSFDQWGVELGKTLAQDIRRQMIGARRQCVPVADQNPSTTRLMTRYLQGDGGYDSQWKNRPEALAYQAEHPLPINATEAASIIIGGIDLEGL